MATRRLTVRPQHFFFFFRGSIECPIWGLFASMACFVSLWRSWAHSSSSPFHIDIRTLNLAIDSTRCSLGGCLQGRLCSPQARGRRRSRQWRAIWKRSLWPAATRWSPTHHPLFSVLLHPSPLPTSNVQPSTSNLQPTTSNRNSFVFFFAPLCRLPTAWARCRTEARSPT